MRIAFTHNLKSADTEAQAEFDTPETIRAISEALRGLGHEVYPVEVAGPASRLVARLETLRPDLVFNTAEGSHGRYREAFYPALFDQLQLPFTGSGAYVCALTLDKQATKLRLERVGVPTPAWIFCDAARPLPEDVSGLRFPVIVKPNFEGSSKGISRENIIHHPGDLRAAVDALLARYSHGVLVEEFIVGHDVSVPFLEEMGVLTPALWRLPDMGLPEGFAICDYEVESTRRDEIALIAPAPLPEPVLARLHALTALAMRELDVHDMGRADFRVTPSGEVFFIEVNALPGFKPGASLYACAALHGLESETDVLRSILRSACARHRLSPRPPREAGALKVGFTFNVKRVDPRSGDDIDAEFDSPKTIQAIADAIARLGHEVVMLEATPELPRILGEMELDLVFNMAEGLRGRTREAQIPALLDLMGIPYTGSDAATMAVALDKGLAKRLVREAGWSTARARVVEPGQPIPTELRFPMIVKPNAEGSSKGVTPASVVRDAAALEAAVRLLHERYRSAALVEEFLPGREFTIGILGDIAPRALPPMEICFQAASGDLPIYTFDHKTEEDKAISFEVPAKVDEVLGARLREVALGCFEALGCRDVARIDLRLDADGEPNFIECNTLPGLSPGFSDLCIIAESCGLDHAALIAEILAPAVRRLHNERQGEV
jgi:D-alanine-D-alanine ligase